MYIRAEAGNVQPRSLAAAFINSVRGDDLLSESIERLKQAAAQIEACYGEQAADVVEMSVPDGIGSLEKIQSFAEQHVSNND